jgi:hypothetical protein
MRSLRVISMGKPGFAQMAFGHIRTGSGSDWVAFLHKGPGVFAL